MTENIIGIAIGGTKSAVTFATFQDGEIVSLEKKTAKTNPNDPDETMEALYPLIDEHQGKFSRISVISGGPLDPKKGVILKPSNLPGFDRFPIVKILEKRYHVPAALLNDADACALAEYRYGTGRGTENFIYLTFGTGFGSGLILNGKLYSGSHGNAGEIGHVRLARSGIKARNGKKGSAESFASGGGVQDWAEHVYGRKMGAREVFALADQGDEKALKIVKQCGEKLGEAVGILVDLFNPDCIAIGGIYPRSLEVLEPLVLKKAKKESLKINYKACRIVPCELREKIDDYSSLMAF